MAELPAAEARSDAGAVPLRVLGSFERIAFRVMRWSNMGAGARTGALWQRYVLEPFFSLFIARRLVVRGLDRLRTIPEGASILLVANHRTFFDLFVLGWILVRLPNFRRIPSFPVRANFFYERPWGLLICLILSGGSMFPPFFRKPRSKAFNRYSLGIVLDKLRGRNNLIGFHPEGTRNKGPDPYQLLPAQPGAGEVALKARPVVVPAFITGLSNKLAGEFIANLRRRNPIVAVFGEPVDLADFPAETRLSHHKRASDRLNERIAALFEEEKAVRGAVTAASPARFPDAR